MKFRRSRQRESILELLRSTKTHPTASWIYDKLKIEFPRLSLGTVYRNLNILTQQGLINKIDCGSTFDRYEARNHPHYHFICEQCGSIFDLNTPVMKNLNNRVSELENITIKRHMIEFFGLCEKCKK